MGEQIRNALIYDGTGAPPFYGSVRIHDRRIVAVESGSGSAAEEDTVFDADGMALSPGFINLHSHMDLLAFDSRTRDCALAQGITTEVLGQDGLSVIPARPAANELIRDSVEFLDGRLENDPAWENYRDYIAAVNGVSDSVHYVGLIGHGTLRLNVMGLANRPPTAEELREMQRLLDENLTQGARGLSLGLIYAPGSYAALPELTALAEVVRQHDGIIMSHIRDEGKQILPAVQEMIAVAEQTGVRMQIAHLKLLGRENWSKLTEVLGMIEGANARGSEVTIDHYPWPAACTGLKACVPQYALVGGQQAFEKRLEQPEQRKQILMDMSEEFETRGGAKGIMVASCCTEEYAWMQGKYLFEIAEHLRLSPKETVLHLLKHEKGNVTAFYFCISEANIEEIIRCPWHTVCTDGLFGRHPNPNLYATYPRFLGRYVRDRRLLPLETAIRRITSEPARRLGLTDRGFISAGLRADLVLFDPDTVLDTNDYIRPTELPRGILAVWTDGKRRNMQYECKRTDS